MSKGGSFSVIINEQGSDDFLNNNNRLLSRIEEFNERAKNIVIDPDAPEYISMQNSVTPILNWIERSHITFVNSSFKPHVPIGFEYTRAAMGSIANFGSAVDFYIKPYGDFWADMVWHIQLTGLSVVDNRDRVRYAKMVGHKIGTNYQIRILEIKIDEYDSELYNIHYNYHIKDESQKKAWKTCMGQESPILGYMTTDPSVDMYREYRWIGNGFQTPKQKHDTLDLWIPLLFWTNDIRHAFPNIFESGKIKITINIANANEIIGITQNYGGSGIYNLPTIAVCELYVNNLFTSENIVDLFLKNFNYNLIRVHNYQIQTLTSNTKNIIELYGLKFPVEYFYFAFRPKINQTMSQYWNNNTNLTLNKILIPVMAKNPNSVITGTIINASGDVNYQPSPSVLVDSLLPAKATLSFPNPSPTDNIYVGYIFVITSGPGYNYNNIVQNRYNVVNYDASTGIFTMDTAWYSTQLPVGSTFELYIPQLSTQYIEYYSEAPVINQIELKTYGVTISGPLNEVFYNTYLPLNFGKHISVPEEKGWYLINFALYPGDNNPTGFLNMSQARESYLYFTADSTSISTVNPVDLIIYSKSINFLILKNNTASLKYSV